MSEQSPMISGKRLLALGGSHAQLVLIKTAKSMGCHVIVCDMNKDCPGSRIADEFYNVSTTDVDALTALSEKLALDGVCTFASDPSALAVAHVASKLGLPANPVDAVQKFTRKDLFKSFLKENGFSVPKSMAYRTVGEFLKDRGEWSMEALFKPSDSSGSRGISLIDPGSSDTAKIHAAFEKAQRFSRAGVVVVEQYLRREGYQIAGDGFVVDGRLAFRCFANEHFNPDFDPLTPIGESFPSVWPEDRLNAAHETLERILECAGIKMGAVNFDFMFTPDGEMYVLEIGPRSGGNLIAEVTTLATGVDMVEYNVLSALGHDCGGLVMTPATGCYSSYVMHVKRPGTFKAVNIAPEIRKHVVDERLYVEPGACFTSDNIDNRRLLGSMILRFDDMDTMLETINAMDRYVDIDVN